MKFSPSEPNKRLGYFLRFNRYTDKNFKYHAGIKQSPLMKTFTAKHILAVCDEPPYKVYLLNDTMFVNMLTTKIKRSLTINHNPV